MDAYVNFFKATERIWPPNNFKNVSSSPYSSFVKEIGTLCSPGAILFDSDSIIWSICLRLSKSFTTNVSWIWSFFLFGSGIKNSISSWLTSSLSSVIEWLEFWLLWWSRFTWSLSVTNVWLSWIELYSVVKRINKSSAIVIFKRVNKGCFFKYSTALWTTGKRTTSSM